MSTNYDQRSTKTQNRRTSGEKTKAKKVKTTKIVIFIVELIIIAVMLTVLYVVVHDLIPDSEKSNGSVWGRLLNMFSFGEQADEKEEQIKIVELDDKDLEIPQEIQQGETMKGYRNIALFGVDISQGKTDAAGQVVDLLPAGKQRDSGLLKGFRSDTIMIASINQDTGDIKLVSVYRDTFLNLGNSNKKDLYGKCNAAYASGGPEQAVKMLNINLDMDIKDFVTVSYWALVEVIDALGGVYIDVDKNELPHLNNYGISIGKTMDVPYEPLTTTGYQLVNGIQAAGYCRIRAVGNDYARTERQREVLKGIEEQAKKANLDTLLDAFKNAQRDICTSLQPKEIVSLISVLWNYQITEEAGFPLEENRSVRNMGAKGSCIVPEDLEANVVWLHQFLFGDEDYTATGNVKEISESIKSFSSQYKKQ